MLVLVTVLVVVEGIVNVVTVTVWELLVVVTVAVLTLYTVL